MEKKWTTIIKAKTGWFDIDFKELLKYKDLIFLFVKRNYVTRYKQTILGPLWLVISPLFTIIMYSIVFGEIAGLSTDGVPHLIFYLSGNIIWSFFATCVVQTSSTFTGNAAIFGKVYFPRLVTPISTVLTSFVDFLIQFILFVIIIFAYFVNGITTNITVYAFLTPILLLETGILGLGFGIIISALTTKYKDLMILVTFGVQLWMYITPVIYSISVIPEQYREIFMIVNPVTPIVIAFRNSFLGTGTIPYGALGISWIVSIIVLVIGVVIFSRVEKTFMDTV